MAAAASTASLAASSSAPQLKDSPYAQSVGSAKTLSRKAIMAKWSRSAGGRVPCHFLQDGVFITIQGEVAPCPMPGRPIAGNLWEQSFDEIWNGEVLTRMRRGFIDGSPERCCAHCSQNPNGYEPADPTTAAPPDYEIAGLEDRVIAQSK